MFDQPIQKKISTYPKDFKPPEGYLNTKINAKYSYNEEFSFQPVNQEKTNQSIQLYA